ncbi:MAG: dTMP kinase, partial [Nitrososphaerales archaeon]
FQMFAIHRVMQDRKKGGILISFEGIDASGKNTQSRMLFDYLADERIPSEYISFPDYATPIGQEIRNFLVQRREYDLESRHLLYAANRYEHKQAIQRWITDGKVVVINRYCESNLAYGVANGLPFEWLVQIESRMPKSDYVFYLRISPEVSAARKRQNRDRYETDLNFLDRVTSVYEALAEQDHWFTIRSDQTREIVHYEIVKTVSSLLAEKRNINHESSSSVESASLQKASNSNCG